MIYLWSVHLNGVRQTFWGQKHFQAINNNLCKKNLNNVRKQICFSGFIKYYHNPKHSGPYTAGRQGGGGITPWENYIYDF
jgi:hypothetical protein